MRGMTSDDDLIEVQMRYRPVGDVLMGSVSSDVPPEKRHREEIDADTFVEWAPRHDGSRQLVGFEVLHARSRTDEFHRISALPDSVSEPAARLVSAISTDTFESLGSAVEHAADSTVEVRLGALVLDNASPVERGEADDALALALSFRALAETLASLPGGTDRARTQELLSALAELAATLRTADGLPAPGATAAARASVRGGLPLTDSERSTLTELLTMADFPHAWVETDQRVRAFATGLSPGGTHNT
ncbi:unannotated protein [freshwater metagenome]|uniref:Unannotated protein n=1 Tax=freshwater metagenome TaxID=449393 RepID=A0A6J6IGF7_9ZZZZ